MMRSGWLIMPTIGSSYLLIQYILLHVQHILLRSRRSLNDHTPITTYPPPYALLITTPILHTFGSSAATLAYFAHVEKALMQCVASVSK